jgi:hypothetical protein
MLSQTGISAMVPLPCRIIGVWAAGWPCSWKAIACRHFPFQVFYSHPLLIAGMAGPRSGINEFQKGDLMLDLSLQHVMKFDF